MFHSDDVVHTEVYRGLHLDLQRAIRATQLEIHYQPHFDIFTGSVVIVEALVRCRHLTGCDFPPEIIVCVRLLPRPHQFAESLHHECCSSEHILVDPDEHHVLTIPQSCPLSTLPYPLSFCPSSIYIFDYFESFSLL